MEPLAALSINIGLDADVVPEDSMLPQELTAAHEEVQALQRRLAEAQSAAEAAKAEAAAQVRDAKQEVELQKLAVEKQMGCALRPRGPSRAGSPRSVPSSCSP